MPPDHQWIYDAHYNMGAKGMAARIQAREHHRAPSLVADDSQEETVSKERKPPEFDPAVVRTISIAVYKMRLVDGSGQGAVERMLAKDGDRGEKLSGRAGAYDKLTRCYLRAISDAAPQQ